MAGIKNIIEKLGPGPLVAAAFIGPGTVMVCTLAGFNYGYELLWAVALSILITVILQEIAGRIGIATGKDLGELIRSQESSWIFKTIQILLVFAAIVIGNIAYESGNLTGARLGLEVFFSFPQWQIAGLSIESGNLIIGLTALFLLWFANYLLIERVLIFLVIGMSISFLYTAFALQPDWKNLFYGLIPKISSENTASIVALIGTTVVPYNLFLYASLAKSKWKSSSSLSWMRWDIGLSVLLGGIVSMAILVVGNFNQSETIDSAAEVAKGLEPVFGNAGKYLMGFGLMAAGLTSSITAPLAAALVICGLLGKDQSTQSPPMRWSFLLIMGFGLIFASFGIRPVQLITIAQVANGVLLPFISIWLIWVANQKKWMGGRQNPKWLQFISILIVLLTFLLGIRALSSVFNWNLF
ncbi:Nramp family divalent metal transporter [Algoriphagus limi]|uniref:Nramp family divalent metal transporter n=1 Tax=Algoriphagus limi TaxID=2975273 RepID=A0ABT2G285_9BACT|nr:Nramp family divalent metal transporter [Algoriphagus limi]MCS5489364.1 Nramp family divalent metal transporter [Algoriphagus limi]